MMKDSEEFVVHVLRTGRGDELNKYIFTDAEHARRWLDQPYVAKGGHRVERWVAKWADCPCGNRYTKLLRRAEAECVQKELQE